MGRRPRYRRSNKEFRRGTIAPWPVDKPRREDVVWRVRYIGSGEHKSYPSAVGRWRAAPRSDKAKWDKIPESEWHQLVEILRAAMMANCVDVEFGGVFPARVWAFVNRVLHEARLSNRDQGDYHAFPLDYVEHWPDDPHNLLRSAPHATIAVD